MASATTITPTEKSRISVRKSGRKHHITVDGIIVGTLANATAAALFRSTLNNNIRRADAVYDTIVEMGEVRVAQVAERLGLDRANATRLIDRLVVDGLVERVAIVRTGKAGRPASLYRATGATTPRRVARKPKPKNAVGVKTDVVLAAIANAGTADTRQVRALTGLSKTEARSTLTWLTTSGKVQVVGTKSTGKGRPINVYRVA